MAIIRFLLLAFALAANAGCAMTPGTVAIPGAGVSDSSVKQHKTFRYTGKVQTFVVPAHVTSLALIVIGAAGGGETCNRTYCYGRHLFGRGGRIYALLPVRPHEELYVYVGGKGTGSSGGWNGGGNPGPGGASNGGGGASDIRNGLKVNDRLIVGAGGGGQGTSTDSTGGDGGGKIGSNGGRYCYSSSRCSGGGGGYGGTQTAGGAGGLGGSGSEPGQPGEAGVLADGGDGGEGGCYAYSPSCICDGYADGCPGGGGGGGYYGGGGGGGGQGEYASISGYPGGGGGGGSSWAEPHAVNVKTWSGWKTATDDGLVVIKWQ
jgi:hypothetical protein